MSDAQATSDPNSDAGSGPNSDAGSGADSGSDLVPPDEDHKRSLARVREGFDLPVDHAYTLVVEPWEVLGCAALSGLAYRFQSSFPIPSVRGDLEGLASLAADHAGEGKLLLFGHSDAGPDPQGASERRAKGIVAFLTKDLAAFQALDDEESWGIEVVQTCLLELGHPPGPVDGEDGAQTQAAVKAFQEAQGLAVDGIAGPNTRRALYTDYLETLSPGLEASAFLDPPALGCGQTHPVVETSEACEDNRRVTAFAFKANRPPLVPGCHDAGGEWYGELSEVCACAPSYPSPTATTLRANGARPAEPEDPADSGPPFEETLELSLVAPSGGPAPSQASGSEVRLRLATEPPTGGTCSWSCEPASVQVTGHGEVGRVALGSQPPAEVLVRCAFVSEAGNSYEAEHLLRVQG